MKLLHINCNYLGTPLHQIMAEHLTNLNIENHIFVPTYDKTQTVIKPNSNVTVSECFAKWDRLVFDHKQTKILKSIDSQFHIKTFDCIHAYTLFTDGNCAMRLSETYHVPYVVAIRNTDVNYFLKYMVHLRRRGIKIMRNAAAIFFLSDSYKNQIFNKYVPKKYQIELLKKSYVIPNGIDDFWLNHLVKNMDLPHTCRLMNKELNLIYAGRIDRNKNIITTQKAIKILEKEGYKISFTVIGKIENKKVFNRIISDKNTNYLESLPKEELIDIYRKNDIFVMPSFTESFGLVYAEAMSQGLPVIYTAGQGFDGQFEEGTVGYHIDPKNIYDIVRAIKKILINYDVFCENCKIKVLKFSWKSIAETYCEIYNSILLGRFTNEQN